MKTTASRLSAITKVAILGGTFDPLHNGHVSAALAVLDAFWPVRVFFIPTGDSMHKPVRPITDPLHRYAMTMAGVAPYAHFDCLDIETKRPGPSYTIDTINYLSDTLAPGAEIILVLGTDAAQDILSWKDAHDIMRRARLAVVSRPGLGSTLARHLARLRRDFGADATLLDAPGLNISGTDLRRRLRMGQSVHAHLPPGVMDYAITHGLYDLKMPDFAVISERIRARISQKRFAHTEGTIEAIVPIAEMLGADVEAARRAALMHDMCKEYSADKMHVLCDRWGIRPDSVQMQAIDMMHGPLAAHTARQEFFCTDKAILDAMICHTTAKADMSALDVALCLADYIEPTRPACPYIDQMRAIAPTQPYAALAIGVRFTLSELQKEGRPIHPNSRAALVWLDSMADK